jgi:hypothetical protein
VTITGKNFTSSGKSIVTKVTFGAGPATHVHVQSATSMRVTAPAGAGTVNVRVATSAGRSAKVAADTYTYRAPATKYLVTASSSAPVAGTEVTISAQLASASGNPVHASGVKVTWGNTGSGGSFGSPTSTTNAKGIATVTFTTSTTVGTSYTVTATDGSSRKGTSPTFTTAASVLEVDYNGTPAKAYSLAELEALTPFSGYAGYYRYPTVYGPDAVTAVKITDIVADALGTPLTSAESVDVTDSVPPPPYTKTFTYSQLNNPATCCTMYDLTGNSMTTFTGTLAAVLVYSDPAGVVMLSTAGPLRFFVADTVSETVMTSSYSVSNVDTLNVTGP